MANLYKFTYDFLQEIDLEGKPSSNKIETKWREVFFKVCKEFNISKRSAASLFDNFSMSNWKHFHMTEKELKNNYQDWLEKFYYDVLYCSDRWSLDRLFRCHWVFLKLKAYHKYMLTTN